jgi:hypothetical protein
VSAKGVDGQSLLRLWRGSQPERQHKDSSLSIAARIIRSVKKWQMASSERDAEMRSDWGNKLGVTRGWLLGAAVVVAALVYLLRR